MPKYNFKCNLCNNNTTKIISMSSFIKLKTSKESCKECGKGLMEQTLNSVQGTVERSLDQIKRDIKEEVYQIKKKLDAGDQELMKEIYGEEKNSLKF